MLRHWHVSWVGTALLLLGCMQDNHEAFFSLSLADATGLLRYDRLVVTLAPAVPLKMVRLDEEFTPFKPAPVSGSFLIVGNWDTLFDGKAYSTRALESMGYALSWTGKTDSGLLRIKGYQDTLITFDTEVAVQMTGGTVRLDAGDLGVEHFAYVGQPRFSEGIAWSTSLALGKEGTPFAGYIDAAHGDKAVVTRLDASSNRWMAAGKPLSQGAAQGLVMAADKNGEVYAGFSDEEFGNQWVVHHWEDGSQSWRRLGAGGIGATSTVEGKMALSRDGELFVAIKDEARMGRASVYQYHSSQDTWKVVGDTGCTPGEVNFLSVAVSPDGIPYIGYYDEDLSGRGTVMRFASDSQAWVSVGHPGFTGSKAAGTVMVIAENGTPYFGFTDSEQNLFQATVLQFDGSEWVPLGNKGFSPGQALDLQLAFAPNGDLYGAFTDVQHESRMTVMRLARSGTKEDSHWEIFGHLGYSPIWAWTPSLAVDGEGRIWTAFSEGDTHRISVMAGDLGP